MPWEEVFKEVALKLPAFAALIWLVTITFKKDNVTAERTSNAFKDEAANRQMERELWANLLQQMIKEKDDRFEALTLKLNGALHDAAQKMGEVTACIARKDRQFDRRQGE